MSLLEPLEPLVTNVQLGRNTSVFRVRVTSVVGGRCAVAVAVGA